MKSLLAGWMALMLTGGACAQSTPDLVTLSKGTEIKLAMAQTLSSKHAYIGQRVELQVAEDVSAGGAILVPKGTRVLGTVTAGKKSESKRDNPGTVSIQVDYISMGERHILLTGAYSDKGKINTGTVIVGAALFGVAGLVATLGTRTGEIKEGAELKGIVGEDVQLPALGHASKPASELVEKQAAPAKR